MDPRKQVEKILTQNGAILDRKTKHEVWKFPDGRTFTRASTPGTHTSDWNSLSDLRKTLGIKHGGISNPDRKEKQPEHGGNGKRSRCTSTVRNTTLADQLLSSGVVERTLREEIAALKQQNLNLQEEIDFWEEKRKHCWGCRIREWWNSLWNR